MSQELLDLVSRFGGSDAIAAMAARVGLTPEQTQSAMAALMPAVAGGLASHVKANGAAALDASVAPATAVVASEGAASDAAVNHGGGLLGALFGGSEATSAVADHAAAATGIDASKLAALLPMWRRSPPGRWATRAVRRPRVAASAECWATYLAAGRAAARRVFSARCSAAAAVPMPSTAFWA